MEKSKIETYLGFCIRAGQIVFGVEMLERKKKGVHLILIDDALGKNSLKAVLLARERLGCPVLSAKEGALGALLHRPAVKVTAITDKNLAAAILSAVEGDAQFKFISGGNDETYGKKI